MLQHIQTIIDSGYIQMNNVYYRARIMLGGDSPWLRLLLGLSPYYAIGSIYSFSTWCSRRERWMNTKVRRTTHLDGKFRALYDKGLDCTRAKGCTSKPMLRVDDRTRFIVMCILHLVIRLGDYLTHFIRAFCKRLPPLVRARVQTLLNESKTNISLKGKVSKISTVGADRGSRQAPPHRSGRRGKANEGRPQATEGGGDGETPPPMAGRAE